MTTINMSGGTGILPYDGFPDNSPIKKLVSVVDFSKFNAGSSDLIQMIRVPANFLVLGVSHRVITAEGGTSTGTIGDGTDPDGWIASVNNNATAGTWLRDTQASADLSMTQALIAGGSAGNHTVTGIATTDTLVSVIHNTAGTLADLTSEFTISAADTINNSAGTDTTGDQLLVTYTTPSAATNAYGALGGKFYASEDTIDMQLSAHAVDTAKIELLAWGIDLS